MLVFQEERAQLQGPKGTLQVPPGDELARKFVMLIEGQCQGLGAAAAAEKYGYSRQRYYQLLQACQEQGLLALQSQKRGPKTNYRRTKEVERQVIRHRFLDPDASAAVITQKLAQTGFPISQRSVERVLQDYGLQKKLYSYAPDRVLPEIEVQRSKERRQREPCDPASLERRVRQLLADKVSGNLVGLWLLIPEHLRLGTWDLLCGWSGQSGEQVEPRLALQLVHEAALCNHARRRRRCLSRTGFELANGLPFVASDPAVHELLDAHTVAESQALQVALGKIRRASGHFDEKLLALDPHRIRSYSKRQMRQRKEGKEAPATKVSQTFFCVDADTSQPVCFTLGTSSRCVSQVTPEVLRRTADILNPEAGAALVMADTEHFTAELIARVQRQTPFELLVPAPKQRRITKYVDAVPDEQFVRRWAGFATTKLPYELWDSEADPCFLFLQRSGERPQDYHRKAFLCTAERDEVADLTRHYPERWHAEEFFNLDDAIGWNRARTMNLNIRYGLMTLALLAQAAIHQLRQRLDDSFRNAAAEYLAEGLLQALDGDLRVEGDTIVVTYYNAPNPEHLETQFSHLPAKLRAEGIEPRIPWLYNFKLDFRFR
ncbi:MAG: hypothetical protein AAB403_04950 [Planctomycetota bacterium]